MAVWLRRGFSCCRHAFVPLESFKFVLEDRATGTMDYHTLLNTQRRLLRRLREAHVIPWSVKTLFPA